jgi:hypothetical protein
VEDKKEEYIRQVLDAYRKTQELRGGSTARTGPGRATASTRSAVAGHRERLCVGYRTSSDTARGLAGARQVRSLAYFLPVIEEVSLPVNLDCFRYLRHKIKRARKAGLATQISAGHHAPEAPMMREQPARLRRG